MNNLAVSQATSNSAMLTFAQVSDGTGAPAKYSVRYSSNGSLWGGAPEVTQGSCSTPLQGTGTSGTLTCSVNGLTASTSYQFQLVVYRGTPNVDAVFGGLSNVASATTQAAAASTDVNGDGATNVTDVQIAVNQALGAASCGAGDVNGDGACNVTDVQKVINAALGT